MRQELLTSIVALLGLFSLSSAHRPEPHLAAIGDSTVAEYPSPDYPAVASLLKGVRATTLAVPGQTIAQQKAVWLGLQNKAEFDIILIQIGLNDMSPDVPLVQTVSELQGLVSAVNHGKRRTAIVVIAQINPASRRWRDLYAERADESLAKWKDLNQSIAGRGPNPIIGADLRVGAHVRKLSTASYALRSEFDVLNDGIHPSAEARRIVACAWADSLQRAGFSVTC